MPNLGLPGDRDGATPRAPDRILLTLQHPVDASWNEDGRSLTVKLDGARDRPRLYEDGDRPRRIDGLGP